MSELVTKEKSNGNKVKHNLFTHSITLTHFHTLSLSLSL